jgi:hypothetical protein
MVSTQRVVVADYTASLGAILVIMEDTVSQIGKFSIVFLDV